MKETFGQRLIRLREELHMSRAALVEKLAIDPCLLRKWERIESEERGIHSKNAVLLAEALHVSVDYLLRGEESHYARRDAALLRAVKQGR